MASDTCVYANLTQCDASEFADDVYKRLPKNIYHDELTTAIDESLQEVRDVLAGLRNNHGCWCVGVEDYEFLPPFKCGERCHRARALWARLEVK